MTRKLTDIEVYDCVYSAFLALGNDAGETVRGNTTLEACRTSLTLLMMGLLNAIDQNTDTNVSIKTRKPDEPC